MKILCHEFNRYRDGMLNAEQTKLFASHLQICPRCRARFLLLENIVQVIRDRPVPQPVISPALIAERAYENRGAWDFLLLSWLRPERAWAGFTVLLILLAFFWAKPFSGQGTDYETLLVESSREAMTMANLSDADLETWLEQGGVIK